MPTLPRSAILLLCCSGHAVAQAKPATRTIDGTVLDMRGEPVPLAEVEITDPDDPAEPPTVLGRSRTDGRGVFRIGHLPAREPLRVRASAPGMGSNWRLAVADQPPPILWLHETATVTGVLRDRDGAPVIGAVVATRPEALRLQGEVRATTDAAGGFTLPEVPLGYCRITAVVPGEGAYGAAPLVTGDMSVAMQADGRLQTTLAIAVQGGPEERPRIRVELLPNHEQVRLAPPWQEPELDGIARLVLHHLPDVDYTIRPRAPGLTFIPREHRIKAGTGPREVKFTIRAADDPAGAVRVRVQSARGAALSGIDVAMHGQDFSWAAHATSDDDGFAVFAAAPDAGTPVVLTSADRRWVLHQGALEAFTAGTPMGRVQTAIHRRLDVVAMPASIVTGTIVAADGQPVPGVTVQLQRQEPLMPGEYSWTAGALTDAAGTYRIEGVHWQREPVRILVDDRGGHGASEPFDMDVVGATNTVPPLRLSPPASVAGIVHDDRGRPVVGARVRCFDVVHRGTSTQFRLRSEVVTDRAGRFRFVGVQPGEAAFRAFAIREAPDPHLTVLTVESGRDHGLDLDLQ